MASLDISDPLAAIRGATQVVVPRADTVGTKPGYELLKRIPNVEYMVDEGPAGRRADR
jgi:hypothetical protein